MSPQVRRRSALGAAAALTGALSGGILLAFHAPAVAVILGVLLSLALGAALAFLVLAQRAQGRLNALLRAEAQAQAADRERSAAERAALSQQLARVTGMLDQGAVSRADLRKMEQRLVRSAGDDEAQVEAYLQLLHLAQPVRALPRARGWAASPDLLLTLVDTVLSRKPRLVVDIGSGLSTVWEGLALRGLGSGRVVALEHDESFAAETTALIERHEVSAHASVRVAALKPMLVDGREMLWYDTAALDDLHDIDLLVVDGPPGDTGEMARLPALPALWDRLAADAVIILDDANRDDEIAIVERWLATYPQLSARRLPHEKGAAVLTRTQPATGPST
ncbi:MAG TPA: class I SAM-dependent methyltransferase [Candidatus Nanopelagicales bacterium]